MLKKIVWGNFLHIYQPPDQKEDIFKRITGESYRPLIAVLKNNPKAKAILNISACLTERFYLEGYKDIIEGIKELVKRGQIELTDSAKYHAFLPLLPEKEVERQIRLNHETNKKILGNIYNPKGFHLPEMAYSDRVAQIVAKLGYSWMILNEISYEGKLFSKIDNSKIYKIKALPKFNVIFRNRRLSDLIQRGHIWKTEEFYDAANKEVAENEYVITAMDGETFGHHRPGLEKFLDQLYKEEKIKSVLVSDIINSFPLGKEILPVAGSWASMESEIKAGIPYAQWKYPRNLIQKKQWELTYLAIKTVNGSPKDPKFKKARKILDKSLFSCQYWWGGAVPWWGVEYIEKGAYFLKTSIDALKTVPKEVKEKSQKLYSEIVFTAFDWERSGLAREKSLKYTEKIIHELGEEIPTDSFKAF